MIIYEVAYTSHEDSHRELFVHDYEFGQVAFNTIVFLAMCEAHEAAVKDHGWLNYISQMGDLVSEPAFYVAMGKRGFRRIVPDRRVCFWGWHSFSCGPKDPACFWDRGDNGPIDDSVYFSRERELFDAIEADRQRLFAELPWGPNDGEDDGDKPQRKSE